MPYQESTPSSHLRDEFFNLLRGRLEKGAEEYGDKSFDKPGTAEEILEEILDVAGWAFVAYVQIKRRLKAVEDATHALELETAAAVAPRMRSAGELAQEEAAATIEQDLGEGEG